jgi:HEAT repeat protein
MHLCRHILCSAVVALSLAMPTAGVSGEELSEAKLLAIVLDASAAREVRAAAGHKLKAVATDRSAKALASLLLDKTTAHMAREVLESLPDPSGGNVLLNALGQVKDPMLEIGLINSLAVRREEKAIASIAKRLSTKNADVRSAAIQALGKIGTAGAAKALRTAQPDVATEPLRADALLRCADRLARVAPGDARAIYRKLYETAASPQKAAALTGWANLGGATADELVRALAGEDSCVRTAALSVVARGARDKTLTTIAASALKDLKPAVQYQLLTALGERGDRGATTAARAALKSDDVGVRAAAASCLAKIGDEADVNDLIALAAAPDDAGVAAREALAVLPGSRTDEALMDRLSRSDAVSKRLAVEILTARAYRPIIEKLYDAKWFEEKEPAKAVVVAIEKLGTKEEFPRALAFAVQLPADRREVLVSRLYVLAKRMSDSARVLAEVQKAIASAGKDGYVDLVGLLALAQEPESLKSLEAFLRDTNVELRKEAVLTIGRWNNAAPAEMLLASGKGDADQTVRILAIRSLLSVLGRPRAIAPASEGVALLRRAVDIAERIEEKQAAIATLAAFKCHEAIEYAESLKSDAQLGSAAADVLKRLQSK